MQAKYQIKTLGIYAIEIKHLSFCGGFKGSITSSTL